MTLVSSQPISSVRICNYHRFVNSTYDFATICKNFGSVDQTRSINGGFIVSAKLPVLVQLFLQFQLVNDKQNAFIISKKLSSLWMWTCDTVWKLRKFTLTPFWQKFRESNGFTREVPKELNWRNIFFSERDFPNL